MAFLSVLAVVGYKGTKVNVAVTGVGEDKGDLSPGGADLPNPLWQGSPQSTPELP